MSVIVPWRDVKTRGFAERSMREVERDQISFPELHRSIIKTQRLFTTASLVKAFPEQHFGCPVRNTPMHDPQIRRSIITT